MATIETAGSTRLDLDGSNRYVIASTCFLTYGGAIVTAGMFGAWVPIGAEAVNGRYEIVWTNATTNQFIVWTTDGSGSFLSMSDAITGSNALIQSLEPGFNQDFSGGGIAARTVIDAAGSTTTATIAGAYVLSPTGSSLGPQLQYGGSLVMQNQFAGWTVLGSEQVGSGYWVAWQNGATFVIWTVDIDGNFQSQTGLLTAAQMQAFEPGFNQDFNGGGVAARSVIESSGGTTLATVAGTSYVLSPAGSSLGPQLKRGGAPVTVGQFGAWTPLAAELSGGMYRMAWRNGAADQYLAWNVDTEGNFVSQGAVVGASSYFLQTFETTVGRDLNGDGTTGVVTSAIESTGNTTLTRVADSYFFNYGSSNIQLFYGGNYVAVGQFGAWTPLAAELSGGMYRVAWKNGGADLYVAWNVDINGNFVSQGTGVTGSTWYVQSYETVVGRDLNGDGTLGAIATSIEGGGNTTLSRVADSYFFNYGSGNIQLRYGSFYAAVGQFGAWAPLAVEFSGGMYHMAWRNGLADQFIGWDVDAGGNFVSQTIVVSGSTWYLQTYEPTVGRDLNGDGLVGPTVTTIETSGMSSLTRVADSYFVNYGSAPAQVQYGGGYAGSNQFANWSAVGAEQTIGAYMVAWRNSASGNYTVWNLDSGGGYIWNSGEIGAGSSALLAIETALQQDLNGGGIGGGRAMVEGAGATALYNASGYLQMVRGPYTGPLLAAGAGYVTAGQYGTALGAEWIGNGYQVAWKTGSDTYNFWTTDTTGRLSSQTGNLSGSSAEMQAFEPTFAQDLNGDGVIGINNSPFDIQFIFSGNTSYSGYFEQAAQKWERVIGSDLPNVTTSQYGVIDDLLITANVSQLSSNILGQATWDVRRTGSGGLPYIGHMTFNSMYMDLMVRDGILTSVIAHEMGHVLGIGTLWSAFGLTSGLSYIGTNALNAYRQLGGTGPLLLEDTGGTGSVGSHWRESIFDRELMTSVAESRDPMPLSIITIGSLADLGYAVNYAAADAYSIPGRLEASVLSASSAATDAAVAPSYPSGSWCGCGCMGPSPGGLGSYVLSADGGTVNPDLVAASAMAPTSGERIATPQAYAAGTLASDQIAGDVSLLTAYLANSFVTPPGDGANADSTATSATQDMLSKPIA